MYVPLVVLGWLYVVLMMAVAEALSPQGSVLGAVLTFLLYGVLPLVPVLYILGTPARRRARRAREAAASVDARDRGGHAPDGAVTPEREEA